ncbi:MAG: hypothetical protein U0744_08785 [Gemmataceae bacterium]
MMPIRFTCQCGRVLQVADHFGGALVRCPECKRTLTAPDAVVAIQSGAKPPPLPPQPVDDDEPVELEEYDPAAERKRRLNPFKDDTPPRRSYYDRRRDDDSRVPEVDERDLRLPPPKPKELGGSSGSVIGGILMMVGALVWFVLGLFADRIFIYPVILFIAGIVALVKGLTQSD